MTNPAPAATCKTMRCGMVMSSRVVLPCGRVGRFNRVARRRGKQRQSYRECRSLPLDALEPDVPAVQCHAAPDDEQPQTGSRNLPHIGPAMERLEQSFLVGLRDAAPMIHHAANGVIDLALHDEVHRLVRGRILYGI